MVNSPFMPNVRGLDEALEVCDKESYIPLFLVAGRLDASGLKSVIIDCSSLDNSEEVRLAMASTLILAVANKMRQ